MLSVKSVDVRSGFWVNYRNNFYNRHCYLCTDACINRWTNAAAILIALSLARLIVILAKAIERATKAPQTPPAAQAVPPNQVHPPLAAPQTPPAAQAVPLNQVHPPPAAPQTTPHHRYPELDDTRESHSELGMAWSYSLVLGSVAKGIFTVPISLPGHTPPRSYVERFYDRLKIWKRNAYEQRGLILMLLAVIVTCAALFTLEGAASVFSSDLIVTDDLALSQAKGCGVYRPALGGSTISNASRNIDQVTETDAASYADLCYDKPDETDGCNFFVDQQIPFRDLEDQPCPFGESICPEDGTLAYGFETDLFHITKLGINVEEVYTARRRAVCTPLNINESFIQKTEVDGEKVLKYFYGTYRDLQSQTPYTWISPASPSLSLNAGYDAYAFRYVHDQAEKAWDPHPDLLPPENYAVNLFLIGSHEVLHVHPRPQDLIFPTTDTKTLNLSGHPMTFYTDTSMVLRPLACLESTVICMPDHTRCQALGTPWNAHFTPKTRAGAQAIYLAIVALSSSNMYSSIRARLGFGLVAAAKLSQAISLPLAEQQGKAEARRLFQTSLAGAQIVMRDTARARWAKEAGLINVFDKIKLDDRAGLCDMYVFHATGWKNLSVVGMIITGATILIIQIAAFEVEGEITPARTTWKLLCNLAKGVLWFIRQIPPWIAKGRAWVMSTWNKIRRYLG